MVIVTLKGKSTYSDINNFEVWEEDKDFFIFYWSKQEYLVLKKDEIISIKKCR